MVYPFNKSCNSFGLPSKFDEKNIIKCFYLENYRNHFKNDFMEKKNTKSISILRFFRNENFKYLYPIHRFSKYAKIAQ